MKEKKKILGKMMIFLIKTINRELKKLQNDKEKLPLEISKKKKDLELIEKE